MFGSIAGNICGTLYFIYFQIAGILIASSLMKDEKPLATLITGSAAGSLMLHWFPVIPAFIVGFTVPAHIAVAVAVFLLTVYCVRKYGLHFDFAGAVSSVKRNTVLSVLFAVTFVLWCILLSSHIIPVDANGNICTGQSTYGDMCMHLSFISSIANQSVFPPQYALFPGTKLAYPFLNASISSSIYIFGASLRWAYILPMLTAFIQVAGGVCLLADTVLGSKAKTLLSYIFFIFNGGLGFIYFTGYNGNYRFSDIFTGYYTTPTNLIDKNIRWVNIIADILLPQRASLFGYAMAFICIWLLHQAVWNGKSRYFYPAALFAAGLPLIHTHSFLAIALISASWLLLFLYRSTRENTAIKWHGTRRLAAFTAVMCTVQYLSAAKILGSAHFMFIGILGLSACIVYGVYLLIKYIQINGYKQILSTWGVYLAICIAFALPQLLLWTFGQVAEGGFLRGHFNWGNLGDFYPWFYIKNIGAPFFLIVGAICHGSRKSSQLILPAAVVWFVAEFILFTPNTYDNNKLLYIAYMLLCIAASDYAGVLYSKLHGIKGRQVLAGMFIFLSVFSAVLTLGREAVSSYQLFNTHHIQLEKYIEENTAPESVIMTGTRHINEAVSLAGRNIVCGSDLYLYFHGIDTTERKNDLINMYQEPRDNLHLFSKYNVEYIIVSSWEKADYAVNTEYFENSFEKIFTSGDVTLYKIP